MEADEIKLAGVRAKLGISFLHISVNISSVRWLEEDERQKLLLGL